MNDATDKHTPEAVEAFIDRWQDTGGKERANYQLFLTELCQLLDLPGPEPAGPEPTRNGYVFERRVDINHPDGSTTRGYIDLYRRGHFVLEAKQVSEKHESSRWDKAMLRAAAQADTYIRALPAEEGRPPFLLTCDVGKTIEVYSEFTRSGATYVPFPDPRKHRIHLEDLREEKVRERLKKIWTDPDSLDPSKYAARVTREISDTLARLARTLEKDGYKVERVAHFIKRCLFTMFCEDVGLLPTGEFTALLQKLKKTPEHFASAVQNLWDTMNTGGYSGVLNSEILRFNGSLFVDINPIALDADQIQLLIDAAKHDWSQVEPAIFGTLLERALDPEERHKLGAHYTPRAYVERLVMPTVIDPLRDEWKDVQAAAAALEAQGKHDKAVNEIRDFHRKLCEIRILDPACGSGNFLYVTLEHMKRLEGEILGTLADLGEGQNLLEMQGNTVDPHQFLGIEINPRAAAIAEMVLWIGYLQWHFRTHGHVNPPQPVLRAFENIECRDAVLAYDRWEYKMNEDGRPVMRWDGKTYKKSPTTGEDIPDESAQVPEEVYINPKKAEWPEADYVVGNPPFIGNKRMRIALGGGYVDALREAWKDAVPESSDFVMYWWHHAAKSVRGGALKRFGLITTNSIKQAFNRRVVIKHLETTPPLSLVFAVPDHPWVDSSDGAAVRISMTVAAMGPQTGISAQIVKESSSSDEGKQIEFRAQSGHVHSGLKAGANISASTALRANQDLCGQGVKVVGKGFYVTPELVNSWPSDKSISRIVNARGILNGDYEGELIIDFFDLTEEQALSSNPDAFQRVIDRVKPLRDQNKRKSIREIWWRFAWERPVIRRAILGIPKYIVTLSTSKHRFFSFLDSNQIWDGALFAIAVQDGHVLGVLSSRVHAAWALAAGGTLEDRPTWTNSTCFDPFPFPEIDKVAEERVSDLAERDCPEICVTAH
ncbi:class I SAM-dependent DNA methyltransferase [Wenzhouxiangella sp. EGI_FJ10305]|uniref:class I SAM-dependent DNA methyltransferase n=1 Tax=Wenzhouxiangella sp. EGI_FJ10305 TaxID=3243768 RepID=UPI0035DC3678